MINTLTSIYALFDVGPARMVWTVPAPRDIILC